MYLQVRKLTQQCIAHEVARRYDKIDPRNCFTEAWQVPPKLARPMRHNGTAEAIFLHTTGFSKLEKIVLLDKKTGKKAEFPADALFVYIGRKPSTGFVNVKKNEQGLIIVDNLMRTSVPGIFAAGDCIEKPLKQIITSVSEGALAATKAREYIQSME